MGQLALRQQLETQRSLGSQAQLVLRGLSVDQIARTSRRFCRNARAGAVSFFANHKEQAWIRHSFSKELLDSANHGGNDAFGVARSSPPEKFIVFVQGKEGRHGVHVRGECHDRLAPARKNIEALRLHWHTFDATAVFSGERRKMAKQEFASLGFVVGHRLDVNERARQLKQIHDYFLEWNEREGKSRRKFGAVTPR